jgi:hypothetical protein
MPGPFAVRSPATEANPLIDPCHPLFFEPGIEENQKLDPDPLLAARGRCGRADLPGHSTAPSA